MSKKWTEQDVLKILEIMRLTDTDSLNRCIQTGNERVEAELGDFIIDNSPGPQELLEEADLNRALLDMVSKLKPREQKVIELRYGLKDGKYRTLDEVGAMYGLTRERIRQIEAKALKRLRWLAVKYKLKERL